MATKKSDIKKHNDEIVVEQIVENKAPHTADEAARIAEQEFSTTFPGKHLVMVDEADMIAKAVPYTQDIPASEVPPVIGPWEAKEAMENTVFSSLSGQSGIGLLRVLAHRFGKESVAAALTVI